MKRRGDLKLRRLERLINPKKIKIIRILEKEKKIHQLDLKKKMKISYRQTMRYVKSLEHAKIIRRKLVKKKQGSPVFISLKK